MIFKTLKTFDNLIEAYLLKSKLENEGIFCFLKDEYQISLNPLYSQALGGIKLQVRQDDWNDALIILKDLEKKQLINNEGDILKCSNCDSTEFYTDYRSLKDPKSLFSIIIAFILFIYPFYYKNVRKCKKCGFEIPIT